MLVSKDSVKPSGFLISHFIDILSHDNISLTSIVLSVGESTRWNQSSVVFHAAARCSLYLEAFIGHGSSVKGLFIGGLQFQRCVAVLLGLREPLQLQVAQGSARHTQAQGVTRVCVTASGQRQIPETRPTPHGGRTV